VRSKCSSGLATGAAGSVATALRPALLKSLAVLVDPNFEVSLRRRRADD